MVDTWKRVGGLPLRNGSETQRDETYSKTSRLGVLKDFKTWSIDQDFECRVSCIYLGGRVLET